MSEIGRLEGPGDREEHSKSGTQEATGNGTVMQAEGVTARETGTFP